jgi:hypothetical protein
MMANKLGVALVSISICTTNKPSAGNSRNRRLELKVRRFLRALPA